MFDQMEDRLILREMHDGDREVWADMYTALFPEEGRAACLVEIDRILASPKRCGFVAEIDGKAEGFAEMNIRDFANGCVSQPVPFLEGIWTSETARRQGVAAKLVACVIDRAREGGFTEIGSDVDQDNPAGLGFHGAMGFEETERVVYFRKKL